jgi:hypothetical protein
MNLRTIQIVLGGALLGAALMACSSDSDSPGAGGGGSAAGTGGAATTGAGAGPGNACSGPAPGYPTDAACAPTDPSCLGQVAECSPLVDNFGGPKFALRMAHLTLASPDVFRMGVLHGILAGSMLPANGVCHLQGNGTFSWLLAFDADAGKLVTGGAKPPADPAAGYAFLDEDASTSGGSLHLGSATLDAPLQGDCQITSTEGDVNLPVYLDSSGSDAIVLPLRHLRFTNVTVSPNHDCIGKFNAETLEPKNSCIPDTSQEAFTDGGSVEAAIPLEEADDILVGALNQSLCVLLTGDASAYGDGGSPNRCKRQNGEIVFEGDWCMATNQAATAGCHDGMRFAGTFAASAVKVN